MILNKPQRCLLFKYTGKFSQRDLHVYKMNTFNFFSIFIHSSCFFFFFFIFLNKVYIILTNGNYTLYQFEFKNKDLGWNQAQINNLPNTEFKVRRFLRLLFICVLVSLSILIYTFKGRLEDIKKFFEKRTFWY